MTNETLTDMWQSNEDFHQRFLGRPANFKEALYAYEEECKELTHAAHFESNENVALEAADTLYTMIGICRSRGIALIDGFDDLMQSSFRQSLTTLEAVVAFHEKSRELSRVANDGTDLQVALQVKSTIYAICGVLRACGVTEEMFLDAMQHVINKNNAKTHETHYINEHGKIQRKGRE